MNGSATPPLLLIANPVAGGGRGRTLATALAAELRSRGCPADCYLTSGPGDGAARARQAHGEGYRGLCAIGGDGTVNEVLNGMVDPSLPLGVLPVGTANVLACELGLPADIAAAASAMAAGHTRPLAIGRVGGSAAANTGDRGTGSVGAGAGWAGGRRFLLFCGIGVDGAVVQRMHEAGSQRRGKGKWLGPIAHTLRHWPHYSLRVTLAGGEVLDDLSSVVVSRVRNYGGVLRLPRDVAADSGRLHVLGFRSRSRVGWLWQGLRGATRTMAASRSLVVRTTTAVQIDGTAPFQLDGDFGGQTPLAIDLLPQTANILVPAPRK